MEKAITKSVARDRGRAVRRWLRRGVTGLVAAAVVGALVWAWLPAPLAVDIALARRGPMTVTVDEDGRALVVERYVVSAPVAGALARIDLEPGDAVEEGRVVARLLPAPPPLLDERSRATAAAHLEAALAAQRQSRARVARGQADASFAAAEARRAEGLRRTGALPQTDLERALLGEKTAAAELEALRFAAGIADHEVSMARIALRQASGGQPAGAVIEVRAPVAGRVLRVMRESEGVVAQGTPLLELGDPAALEVVVDLLSSDAVRVRPGAAAVVDGWGGAALDGRVSRVEPSAFTRLSSLGVEEQRVNVHVELRAPRDQQEALADGYRVEVHVTVWHGAEVIAVPASAVFRHGDGWAVYRVQDGVARVAPVSIGERTGREVQIVAGLEAGTPVIVYPGDRVGDSVRVAARAP